MTQAPGRRERKKQQTREKIARVAMELFIERGFDQVTVPEVADVSVNTVYNYFPTKEDLFWPPSTYGGFPGRTRAST
ncbi:TetR/AcrR family transcriptional regulator [Ktedonosporobacter rubrisoli]|uniref:TetR/AcrR family transcriptional regulator n=1 Tax=Ktedonosporobacter rubrisoli TaxID=2509675 RepID=A0A4P6JPY7_KTERU|nr:TetR/AcrR family transcriptional regulator [Ktedonosporobacter rubrisoli]QBD77365.1 TetR/AcrR family transcriptional regulator [Ktedonosporobacter rubrisoli]